MCVNRHMYLILRFFINVIKQLVSTFNLHYLYIPNNLITLMKPYLKSSQFILYFTKISSVFQSLFLNEYVNSANFSF